MYAPVLLPQAKPPSAAAPSPHVVTWLAPSERPRVALCLEGSATLAHHDTLDTVRSDLIRNTVDAVLVSSARVGLSHVPALARLVRDFGSVPVLGLAADETGPETLTSALLLGRAGVLAVYDADSSIGLAALRSALARNLPAGFQRQCVSSILTALAADGRGGECDAGCTRGVARFFAEVFAPNVSSAKCLAAVLGVHPATLASRFQRAALPSVKQYIAHARLVLAARLGETPGLSMSAIAHRLDASSPQSFNRTIRTLTGLSAVEFRRAFTGAAMLDRYRATLVTPFREILRGFDPLGIESRRTGASEPAPAIVGRAA